MTLLIMLGFFLLPWFVRYLLKGLIADQLLVEDGLVATGVDKAGQWMIDASPITRLLTIISTGFGGPPVAHQVISNLIISVLVFLLSWMIFVFFNRYLTEAAPDRPWTPSFPGRRRRHRRAWRWALVWKDFYFFTGGTTILAGKMIGSVGLTALIVYLLHKEDDLSSHTLGEVMMITYLCVARIEWAVITDRIFRVEVRWRTWPVLCGLPTSVARTAYLKIAGCALALIPALTFFAVGVFLNPAALKDAVLDMVGEPAATMMVVALIVFSCIWSPICLCG